jgi:anthranilate synthase component 2
MYLLIDNYDSFTYNLYHYLGEVGAEMEVVRNDQISVADALAMQPEGVILSPGPCTPNEAGICLEMVQACAERSLPLLGVCLGHQSIGQAFGGQIVRAQQVMHGKISEISHENKGLFAGLPNPLKVTRYHSLTIDPASLPDCLEVTARSDDGVIQGVQHKSLPIHGLQFHPESIASQRGKDMLANFLSLSRPSQKAA